MSARFILSPMLCGVGVGLAVAGFFFSSQYMIAGGVAAVAAGTAWQWG